LDYQIRIIYGNPKIFLLNSNKRKRIKNLIISFLNFKTNRRSILSLRKKTKNIFQLIKTTRKLIH